MSKITWIGLHLCTIGVFWWGIDHHSLVWSALGVAAFCALPPKSYIR